MSLKFVEYILSPIRKQILGFQRNDVIRYIDHKMLIVLYVCSISDEKSHILKVAKSFFILISLL